MIGSMPLCHSVGTHDAVNDADDVDDDDGDDDGEADDDHDEAADADNTHDHNEGDNVEDDVLGPLTFSPTPHSGTAACHKVQSQPQGALMQH